MGGKRTAEEYQMSQNSHPDGDPEAEEPCLQTCEPEDQPGDVKTMTVTNRCCRRRRDQCFKNLCSPAAWPIIHRKEFLWCLIAVLIIAIIALLVAYSILIQQRNRANQSGSDSVSSELCPRNWIGYRNKCYFFSVEEGNWTSSQNFCLSHNASLARIEADEEDFLKPVASKGIYWIGLQGDHDWKWLNGDKSTFKVLGEGGNCAFWDALESQPRASRCSSPHQWFCSCALRQQEKGESRHKGEEGDSGQKRDPPTFSKEDADPQQVLPFSGFSSPMPAFSSYTSPPESPRSLWAAQPDLRLSRLSQPDSTDTQIPPPLKRPAALLRMERENQLLQNNMELRRSNNPCVAAAHEGNEGTNRGNHPVTLIFILTLILILVLCAVTQQCPAVDVPLPPIQACPSLWINYEGKCYFFSEEETDWTSGRSFCAFYGSTLAVIESEQEKAFILRYIMDTTGHWIGLSKDSTQTWKWADGQEFKNTLEVKGKSGDCAFLNTGFAMSSDCQVKRNWICSQPDTYTRSLCRRAKSWWSLW
ncbi:uncharacterized protein LOC133378838 [Rhineura floridana]|uniref:uncharacterized protein LOC133378838 n=1 Tax=Rhineura floridana TaxID=261503 RepID=UPI002AC8681E|nr:uncharacterized protein LOC133378838 [Rhineura floridana]